MMVRVRAVTEVRGATHYDGTLISDPDEIVIV
jgi:hypothetical protein